MSTRLNARHHLAVMGALVAVLAAALPTSPVHAAEQASYTATIADAQAAIATAVDQGLVDAIGASITTTDALVWAGAGGRQDARTAASTSTTFGIGSVSKMFATTAVMQLVDQGKVGLDQPVVKYLPKFTMRSPQYRQITVRMLLNHSAGLPGTDYTDALLTSPRDDYAKQVLQTLSRSTLKTTPGALSVYCNDCFILAGEVVAAVSGMTYPQYVERNIFAPLGMAASTFASERDGLPPTMARVFENGKMQPQEYTGFFATGGAVSTPIDMAKFARMLLGKGTTTGVSLLSPQSVAEMGRSQVETTLSPVRDPYMVYGLGWDTVRVAAASAVGLRAWSKNGATYDYHSILLVAPEAGIAVFVNAAGRDPSINGTVQALAEGLLFGAAREGGAIAATTTGPLAVPAPATPSVDDINAMLGIYLATGDTGYRVERDGEYGLMLASLRDGSWVDVTGLSFRADGNWWPADPQKQYWQSVVGWSRTYLALGMVMGDRSFQLTTAQRVHPSGPTNPAWVERAGEWLIVNERPESLTWAAGPVVPLAPIPGLPGYVRFAGVPLDAHAAGIATVFAQIPVVGGRDQDDVVVMGPDRLRGGNAIYRSRASVPTLASGTTTLRIGGQGYAEWAQLPAVATVAVRGASAWKRYDADVNLQAEGRGAVTNMAAAKGDLLVVFGKPGQIVTVTGVR